MPYEELNPGISFCQRLIENLNPRLDFMPKQRVVGASSDLDALDLQRRALVRARQQYVHGSVARADGLHAHHPLVIWPRTTQRAGARLNVVRRRQLTHVVAYPNDAIGNLRFTQIEAQWTDGLAPLCVEVRLGHAGFALVYV